MKTQYDLILKAISRKRGATPMELIEASGSTCPHKRIRELEDKGHRIEWIWRSREGVKAVRAWRLAD